MLLGGTDHVGDVSLDLVELSIGGECEGRHSEAAVVGVTVEGNAVGRDAGLGAHADGEDGSAVLLADGQRIGAILSHLGDVVDGEGGDDGELLEVCENVDLHKIFPFCHGRFLRRWTSKNFYRLCRMEQATGIEPAHSAWKADVLPLNYACKEFIHR